MFMVFPHLMHAQRFLVLITSKGCGYPYYVTTPLRCYKDTESFSMHHMRKYHEHFYLVSLLFAETFLLTIIFSNFILLVPFIFCLLIRSSICNVNIAQVIRPSN